MITEDQKMGIMSKLRGEIEAGLRRQALERYENELRLAMAHFSDEEKIIFLTNDINVKAAAKALRGEENVNL